MNEALIEKWNACVKPGDTIYHLGDFAWRGKDGTLTDANLILRRLNGQKFLMLGTHDEEAKRLKHRFCQQTQIKEIDIDHQHVVMGHYSMRVFPRSHYGAFLLFGHSHGNLPPYGKSFDVGVDTCYGEGHTPFSPYSWDEVKCIMESLGNNWVDKRYVGEDNNKDVIEYGQI